MILQRSTDEVDATRRFDYWRETICDTFVDLEPGRRAADDTTSFAGDLTGGQVGEVRLCTVSASTHEVTRTPALIRRTGGDFLFVSVLLDGKIVYVQEDRVAELAEPGQMVLYDSAKPYRVVFRDRSRQLVVRIPRQQLDRRLGGADRVTAVTLSGDTGAAGLASGLLQSLCHRVHDVDPHVTQPLLDNVLAVMSAAFVSSSGLELRPMDYRVVYLQRAHDYIRRHVGDAQLTPTRIAGAIGVSERYLYALFRSEGSSPAKVIMDERLSRAWTALEQPRQVARTMESLAHSLGFKHAAHFTRAFKDRYGMPPSQHREQALARLVMVVPPSVN